MKIQSNFINIPSFSAKFRTEDVLRFLTQYPYKQKNSDKFIVKELTGIDLGSDEFISSITEKDSLPTVAIWAIIGVCSEHILKQNKALEEADATFNPTMHLEKGRKSTDEWFKEQIKKLGQTINLEPFTVTFEEIKDSYNKYIDIINKCHL